MSERADILLCMCPPFGPESPPLSLACLAAAARGAGFSARVLDLNIRVYRAAAPEFAEQWSMDHKAEWVWPSKIEATYARFASALDAGVDELAAADAGAYGFSCHSDNRLMVQEIIRRLKARKPDAFVIVGGMGVFAENSMRRFDRGLVDAFVVGPEGEGALVEILRARKESTAEGGCATPEELRVTGDGLRVKKAPTAIPGVLTREGAIYSERVERAVATDLDVFPWPTFEDFDLAQYTTSNLPILTSRGCRGRCLFCNDRVLMGPQRNRSAENLFEEIRYHVEKQGVHDFSFNDLQINFNIEQIDRFCTMVTQAGLAIRWTANAIVSDSLAPSVLRNLRAAGCHTLTLGIESGSPRVVKRMNKGYEIETARRLMRDIKEAGITLWVNLVIGFPGESDETVAETLQFIEEHGPLIDEVCVCNTCNILEYSILWEKRAKFGIAEPEDPDWFEVSWRTEDGVNTPEKRMEWLGRVIEALDKRHIPVRQTNFHFSGEDSYWGNRRLDVLLSILPPHDTDSPPYELVQSAAYLQSVGLSASCVDLNIETFRRTDASGREFWELECRDEWARPEVCRKRMESLGLDAHAFAERLLKRNADNLAFFIHRPNLLMTKSVLEALREKAPGKRIILFGPSTSISAERDLFTDDLCNYMIIGEVEASLAELVRRLADGESLATLRGVRCALPDGSRHFIPREPIRDLSLLPIPDYRELRPEKYGDTLRIRMSRGCRWRCAFCMQQPYEGPGRWRTAASVHDEMAEAYRKHDIRAFEFSDLVANGDLSILEELADRLAASKLPIRFGGYFAPTDELTPELFRKLADVGFTYVRFGVESFSGDVLRLMNKTYTAAVATKNLRDAHEAGVETHVNLLVGFPGETYEDFLKTVRGLKQAEPWIDYVDTINACEVWPKTAIERNSVKYVVLMPANNHSKQWSYKSFNNLPWRATRVKEMAIWVAGLDVKFNYDYFVRPTDPIRKMEGRIRKRLAEKSGGDIACVLINMPPWGFTNPPVGPALLASYLDLHGFPAKVLDYNAAWYNAAPEDWKLLWHVENKNYWSNDDTWPVLEHAFAERIGQTAREIIGLRPRVVGFTAVDPRERMVIAMIRKIRELDRTVRIILGGPAIFTPEYREIFFERAGESVDGCVVGEGEETLLEILQATRDGRPLSGIPGVITREADGPRRFVPRGPIADLDSVPFPTYGHFDMSLYRGDSLVLEWSRGCVASCVYCKGRNLAGKYRSRSAGHIFAELKHHVERLGFRSFTVSDNILNGRPRMLEELCDRIIAEKLPIRWNAEAAPMANLTRELLAKLKAAGCFELQLGVETGSPRVLELMDKAKLFSIDAAERVLRDTHEAGIKTCMFCMVGFPGETEEDFVSTLAFIERNAPWIDQVKSINSCHIITGTELHLNAASLGITLPKDDYHYLWIDANGLDITERNNRVRRVLALVQRLGLECLETNLAEGKQRDFAAAARDPSLSMDEKFRRLLAQANSLGSFDAGEFGEKDRPGRESASSESADEIAPDAEFVRANLAAAGVLSGRRVYAGPEILEIDLTNRCNLHCAGCWNHGFEMGEERWTGEIFKRTLPTETALAAIREAAAHGARMVQFSGAGEPLLHPEFPRILEEVKSLGLSCTVITNGTLLDEKILQRFVDAGLDNLTVSVWAGTPEMYAATHPKTPGKTFLAIRDSLRRLHAMKQKARRSRPHVKIYNVINRINAGGIDDMISFALDGLADYVEFTPVDIVAGRSGDLALTPEDRERIKSQLDGLVRRKDFIELDPAQGPKSLDGTGEGKEFARFVKYDILPKGFRYELDDITRFDVLCPRKEWRLDVREDNTEENALLFFYPSKECTVCPLLSKCEIDKERFAVKVEFLSVLGFGAFYRRITSPGALTGGYDAEAVRNLPCNIGWTYARVGTDGSVIPCCKAKRMPLGNLGERGFMEIWTSPPYAEFRAKALSLPKDDPYFAPIECLKACDNLGMIFKMSERIATLTDRQKESLAHPERAGIEEMTRGKLDR